MIAVLYKVELEEKTLIRTIIIKDKLLTQQFVMTGNKQLIAQHLKDTYNIIGEVSVEIADKFEYDTLSIWETCTAYIKQTWTGFIKMCNLI